MLWRTFSHLRRGDVLLRLGLCALATLILYIVTQGWAPPFSYRTGDTPSRDIVARIRFEVPDDTATQEAKERAKKQSSRQVLCIYEHDPAPLEELRHALKDRVFQVIRAESYDELDESVWRQFMPSTNSNESAGPADLPHTKFNVFREALADDLDLAEFEKAVGRAFVDYERQGLLETLQHESDQFSHKQILVKPIGSEVEIRTVGTEVYVYVAGSEKPLVPVDVTDVRIAEVGDSLSERLAGQLMAGELAEHVFAWLKLQLPTTLSWNPEDTRKAADDAATAAAAAVDPVKNLYEEGKAVLWKARGESRRSRPLTKDAIQLLQREYDAQRAALSHTEMIGHSLANLGMYLAMYVLCGFYIFHREQHLLGDLRRFSTILCLFVLVVALGWLFAKDHWRAELVPLVLFGMIITIAYRQELALLLSAVATLVVILSSGQGLAEFVIFTASAATAIQTIGHIRSRTKLIYVGLCSGGVTLLTTLGVHTMSGSLLDATLLWNSIWYAFCAVLAALLMTGLLPFIESLFDVQTEISLLELGDAAHPLLQELVRRAPGTYNHSINVASIAEAAAEAIGANGLLVRVGAYFHDIGKMLKPVYFAENQGQEESRHESLVPAMSTLVIVAHVKDGADLARQHRLPKSFIDFIEQHHGTTLVEYFFDQAKGKRKEDPESSEVDESTFRYPGPKPQTKEAGVMMLADAVESASRSLVDPTPARIESLVKEIAMKRLLDGQLDASGLTLTELHLIQHSLVKSLTAVYHGRVKYPEQQQTA